MKCRAVFGLALAPVVEAGSGNIRVSQPLLHFGDVRLVRERVCCRWCPERMHAQPVNLGIDACDLAVLADDVAIDGARLKMLFQLPYAVVFHGTERGRLSPRRVSRAPDTPQSAAAPSGITHTIGALQAGNKPSSQRSEDHSTDRPSADVNLSSTILPRTSRTLPAGTGP